VTTRDAGRSRDSQIGHLAGVVRKGEVIRPG
jgi:hypothetical protein